ncbi:hypothetical protein EW146_g5162 [Bondarzewia mesenterica]|uniref:Chromo domain-containing protein n=1 Tax=Bondarzewia mesenterica TaxID=1095465 RepID=A0A4S4LTD9_9AGAM|nr:hypothetical protein EW146_g5162 [Bondarzewia mesenterica]
MHFTRLGIPPARRPRVIPNAPPGMSVVDLEHSLCECEKYSRVMHPEIRGKRTTIHRNWEPKREPLTNKLPRRRTNPVPSRKKSRDPPPPVDPTESDPSYHVSHIVMEEQGSKEDGTLYLIRWLGYGPGDDQWLTEEELRDAKEVLHEWCAAKASIADKVSALQVE